MATNWILRGIGFLVGLAGLTAHATPEFRFTMTCTPVNTYNWRVIASVNADMSAAITISVNGSFTPTVPSSYPATQGPSSGTLGGYGSQQFYFRYQVQGAATGGNWQDFGIILGPVAANGSMTERFEYTPPNCIPTGLNNPDIPVTIGNNNPYGGTFTPTVGGTPIPPPSDWTYPPIPPYTGPWPPYIPPGGTTNIIINVTNLTTWGATVPGDITWVYNASPPPTVTNQTTLTNITTTVTNINGTNMVINVTNTTVVTSTSGGVPSGGGGMSAEQGTELLSLAALESLGRIEGNTKGATNILEQIRHNQTNTVLESTQQSEIDAHRGIGESSAASFTNLLNVPVFSGETSLSTGPGPVLTFTYAPGKTFTFDYNNSDIMGMLSMVRAFAVYMIFAVTAFMCWTCIEENVRQMLSANQFRNASTSVPVGSMKGALICAAIIVAIWVTALGLIMAKFSPHGSYLTDNPLSYLTGFPYLTFLNSIFPLVELISAVFAYISFRIAALSFASFATIAARFIVGL